MAADALDRITKLEVQGDASRTLLAALGVQLTELDKRLRHVERMVYVGVGIIATLQVLVIVVVKSGAV